MLCRPASARPPRLARAQTDTIAARSGLIYGACLTNVGRNNLALAAQLYNVNVAEAALEPAYQLASLLDFALANRADLVAARQSQDAAVKNLRLTKADRMPDIDLAEGNYYYTISRN